MTRRPVLLTALALALGFIVIGAPSCTPTSSTGDTWTLVAGDDFNGSSLDTTYNANGDIAWRPNWFNDTGPSDPVNTYETACYQSDHVQVGSAGFFGDGMLTLSITDPGHTTYCPKPNVPGGDPNPNRPYIAGMISSRGRFQTHPTSGHPVLIEARIYIQCNGAGEIVDWPAFWTVDTIDGTTGENDIVEGLDGDAEATMHGPFSTVNFGHYTNACGWHVFGLRWAVDSVKSYLDGSQVGTYTSASNVSETDQYIILGAQIGPEHMYGGPVVVPALMGVDWVAVYQVA